MRLYCSTYMEDGQNEQSRSAQESSSFQENPSSGVSFPTVGQPKKSNGAKTFLIIGILVLVGILGFVIYKSATNKEEISTEPTPFDNLTTPTEGEVAPTPSATPKAIDKSKVKVEVQNGTGITGEAAYLQTQLKNLGYTNIKVGNAGQQDATITTVTFSKSLSSDVVDELTQKLKALYQTVSVKTSSTLDSDVLIVTGLRKGVTPKPSATPTVKPSASPSPTPTATP